MCLVVAAVKPWQVCRRVLDLAGPPTSHTFYMLGAKGRTF